MKEGVVSVTAVVLMQPCQEMVCVSMRKQKHFIWQLGIIVMICLQQNSTTQMFEFVQRILWTTVLWT